MAAARNLSRYVLCSRSLTARAQKIPLLDTVLKDSLMQWLCFFHFGADLHHYHNDFVAGTSEWILDDLEA